MHQTAVLRVLKRATAKRRHYFSVTALSDTSYGAALNLSEISFAAFEEYSGYAHFGFIGNHPVGIEKAHFHFLRQRRAHGGFAGAGKTYKKYAVA